MNFTEKRKRELNWNEVSGHICFDRQLTPLNSVRVVQGNGREVAFASKEVEDAYRIARVDDDHMVEMIQQGKCPVDYPHKIYRI